MISKRRLAMAIAEYIQRNWSLGLPTSEEDFDRLQRYCREGGVTMEALLDL